MAGKILIVNGSPAIRSFVGTKAITDAFEIQFALNGAEALVAACKLQPDLILLEIQQSSQKELDGCIFALKADSLTRDIPIICLGSAATLEDQIHALDSGAVDCLVAPFDPSEVQARIRAAIRTRSLIASLSRKAMIDGLTGLWNSRLS